MIDYEDSYAVFLTLQNEADLADEKSEERLSIESYVEVVPEGAISIIASC